MLRAMFRRVRRQCARRWHSLVPLSWLCRLPANGDHNKMPPLLSPLIDADSSGSYTTTTIFGLLVVSALLSLPPFVLALFLTGLADHFFETPFAQFRWSEADVRSQVAKAECTVASVIYGRKAGDKGKER
ncbi:hypothetical protein niasHS_005080 [Heterodera schachtii]|uniref:Uncharacterized protein n=1 Tax=Heterodera schachtii TaxID=97005 RepID=A0ABD2JLR6_HETSC